MASVWTGQQMLIWGGDGPHGQFADGAGYDPRSDTWTLLPAAPLSARNQPAAVWTGDEMILWGGSSSDGDHNDGAAYNPSTHQWRTIANAPFTSSGRPVGLWTGTEMIVLAGFNSRDAAAYDPAHDKWRTLPSLPGQLQAPNPVGVWTGDEVVTVVQPAPQITPGGSPRIVALRIDGDEWSTVRDLTTGPVVLAWTGKDLLVGDAQLSVARAGGHDHDAGQVLGSCAVGHDLDRAGEVDVGDVVSDQLGPETLRLLAQVVHEVGSHDAVREAREVLYIGGVHQRATSCHRALEHQRCQIGTRGVDGRCITSRAGADDDHVAGVGH